MLGMTYACFRTVPASRHPGGDSRPVKNAALHEPALDAVDGSSTTGTRVPKKWALLWLPRRFGNFGSSVGGVHGQKSRAADHPQDG